MSLIQDLLKQNQQTSTVDVEPNLVARFRPTPQNISPVPNPVRADIQAPSIQGDLNAQLPPLNPNATLDPNMAQLGNFSITQQQQLPQPQPSPQNVTDVIGFNSASQPQNRSPVSLLRPQLQEQPIDPTLDEPLFAPPQFDYNSLQPTADTLYGGRTRQELIQATNRALPTIQPANPVAQRLIPRAHTGESPRRSRVAQSQNWLDRVLGGVRGNNLVDRAINTLLHRVNPFLGAQFGDERSEFARTGGLGFTRADGTQWTPNNDDVNLNTFGEYGNGALGLLFYGLDFLPNLARAAVLDIGANTRALGATLSERGGASLWREDWRQDFGDNRRLYDAVPEGHEYESYITRAFFGDDLSFINFGESLDGSFNPLGVLGASANDFYRDQNLYQQFVRNPIVTENTNWFQRLMLSPSGRLAPRALAAFGLEVFTDPIDGGLSQGINSILRRVNRRAVQVVPPLHRLLPAVGDGAPRTLPTPNVPNPRTYVQTPRGTRALPDNFVAPSAQPRVAVDTPDVSLGQQIRQRIREGQSLQQAIDETASLSLNPDQFRNITTPQWTAPTTLYTNQPIPLQWSDVARSPRVTPGSYPVRRAPIERRALVNNIVDIIPPTLDNTQIDRVINALPPRLSDEVALVARNFGSPIGNLPAARTDALPRLLPNVGSRVNPIDNVRITRTARNTIRIELDDLRPVNFDEFDPLLRSLRADFNDRLEIPLPARRRVREQLSGLLENYGFFQRGNRMVSVIDDTPMTSGVLSINQPTRALSDIPITPDRIQYRERYPFGNITRATQDLFILTVDEVNVSRATGFSGLTRQQRVSLRNALATAPDNANILVNDPLYADTVFELMQEGFVIRNADTGALATPQQYLEVSQRQIFEDTPLYELRYEPSARQIESINNVQELPTARGIVQRLQDQAPIGVDETGETLEQLFRRADEIIAQPRYNDNLGDNIVERVANNTGRPRGQYTENIVREFNTGQLQVPVRQSLPTQDELVQAAQEGDDVVQALVARAEEILAQPQYDNPSQYAVDQLVNPDIVNNPTAYAEVRGTLSDALAPYSPNQREAQAVADYVQSRSTLEGLMGEHSDLAYQLDQLLDMDVEAFYDELLMAGDELTQFEEPLEFLQNDDMYDVLIELFNDMVSERTSRNVQRYLSQLEYTVREQLEDLSKELYASMDELFHREELLRGLTTESNRRYIDDVLAEGDLNRQLLDNDLGQSSRGNCI